jgi:hypothetical protein
VTLALRDAVHKVPFFNQQFQFMVRNLGSGWQLPWF